MVIVRTCLEHARCPVYETGDLLVDVASLTYCTNLELGGSRAWMGRGILGRIMLLFWCTSWDTGRESGRWLDKYMFDVFCQ